MLARKIILGFGFAVLLPMLVHYGIDVFVPSASLVNEWSSQWREETLARARELKRLRAREREANAEEKARLRQQIDQLEDRRAGEERVREAKRDRATRTHFFIGAPLGIVVTLVGSLVRVQAIGGGLMLGGIFTFTQGCF
jgi:hypothetical protein